MIIPGLVKELDTTEFCKLLKISKDYFDNKIERTKDIQQNPIGFISQKKIMVFLLKRLKI